MKTKLELGKSVSKSVWTLVATSVPYSIRESTSKLIYYSIYRSTWRQINILISWNIRL
jgi:hypothetical protein